MTNYNNVTWGAVDELLKAHTVSWKSISTDDSGLGSLGYSITPNLIAEFSKLGIKSVQGTNLFAVGNNLYTVDKIAEFASMKDLKSIGLNIQPYKSSGKQNTELSKLMKVVSAQKNFGEKKVASNDAIKKARKYSSILPEKRFNEVN